MDGVKQLEELMVNLIGTIAAEKRTDFVGSGYDLDSEIERVSGDSYYESEAYVLLKDNGGVVELYPIQLVFAVEGQEPVLFVRQESLPDLEKEIRVEIEQWEEKYLSKQKLQ